MLNWISERVEKIARRVFWNEIDEVKFETTTRLIEPNFTIKVSLDGDAKMPSRANDTDAGADIFCTESFTIPAKSSRDVDTGVHVELPHNTVGILMSNSNLNIRARLVTDGVIGEGCSDSIKVCIYNHGDYPYAFKAGDKIAQLVVVPVLYPSYVASDEPFDGCRDGADGIGRS